MNEPDNSKIYTLGSVVECPKKIRDQDCCYNHLIDLDLKNAYQKIVLMPNEERWKLIHICQQCLLNSYN